MGKKAKGPPLTPEEKKKLRAEKKLAKKLALEEKKRQQKRDYLQREIDYSNTNRKILEQKWRDIQMAIQVPYLQIQFEFAVNMSEAVLDLKDYQISLLLDELDEADEQYNANLRAHMHNINKVIDYYHAILDDVKREYEKSYSNLVQHAKQETHELQKKFDNDSDYLNMMIFRLAEEKNKMSTILKSEYIAKIKLEEKTVQNEIHIMSDGKCRTFMDIWNSCNKVVEAYQNSVKEKEKEFNELNNDNNYFRKIISEQASQIYNMQRKIYTLHDHQAAEQEKYKQMTECKITEQHFFHDVYNELRAHFDEDTKLDTKQITDLVIHSNIAIKNLSKIQEHCGKVIKHHSFISKYETHREKYLPFPISLPLTSQVAHLKNEHQLIHTTTKELRNFWMKCAQVDALRHTIWEEYEHLKRENNIFKKLLANYCTMQDIC